MDFFQKSNERKKVLSQTETTILDYVLKHMHKVHSMSIRELAMECFVSTATVFRFVKKMEYSGYTEFLSVLKESDENINSIVHLEYRERYMKNIMESVQLIQNEKSRMFCHIMGRYPRIFLLANGLSSDIANYAYQILTICGFIVEYPKEKYEVEAIARKMKRDDVLLVFSYSGMNQEVLQNLNDIFMVATPTIISFTKVEGNEIQNMSDLNFSFCSEQAENENIDITSRCGMLAVFEVLVYQIIARNGIH